MPTISQQKQYGDTKRLEQLSSGMKQGNADPVPTLRTPVGRPQGSLGPTDLEPIPGDEAASPLPPEHIAIMENAARAVRVSDIGKQVTADPLAGPWLRVYAQIAEEQAADKLRQVKDGTPDYEE